MYVAKLADKQKWKEAYNEFIQEQSECELPFFSLDSARRRQMELAAKDETYDPLGINNAGISGIFEPIKTGDMEVLKKYLDYGCPLTVKDEDGLTPIELAVKIGNVEAVHLIERVRKQS